MTHSTDVHPAYLAVGANRQTAAADWGPEGTLCFGAGVNLALWRPCDSTPRGVVGLLNGHSDTVKAVQFLPLLQDNPSQGTRTSYVVSGGDDHSLKLWAIVTSSGELVSATCLHTVEGAHTAPINCIASAASAGRQEHGQVLTNDDSSRVLFVSGAADATIKIWGLEQPQAENGSSSDGFDSAGTSPLRIVARQTIQTKPRYFPLCLALVALRKGDGIISGSHQPAAAASWVLAAAGTSTRIQIFVGTTRASNPMDSTDGTTLNFTLQASLSGHEGWIRSLDFGWETDQEAAGADSDILLASASQDKYIRLWRIHKGSAAAALGLSKPENENQAAFAPAPSISDLLPGGGGGKTPSNKAHKLVVAGCDDDKEDDEYAVTFEALLLCHDDWIYSARWAYASAPQSADCADTSSSPRRLRLLSASADNSLGIWEADPASGIWVTTARLGELSKEKGATTATGSVGGFWTGLWGPPLTTAHATGPQSVVTLCRTGSWRRWDYDPAEDRWVQAVAVSGHVAPVRGVAWSRNGAYLLSTSGDQTTRLHAEWKTRREDGTAPALRPTWHEMSRPQIHGYDLNCIDTLGPTQFVSGADEKLMRVFHEPKTVARLLRRLAGPSGGAEDGEWGQQDEDAAVEALPDAANMPVLGLSNKAVDEDQAEGEPVVSGRQGAVNEEEQHEQQPASAAAAAAAPPTEDILARSTLWPESEKLYGHGFEISCLAVSPSGRLVASACRATSLNHAVIRLFETERWTEVRPPLALHTLTVARLRFGAESDDEPLLSVGRDRQWGVWQKSKTQKTTTTTDAETDGNEYTLRQANAKAHTRMILDCDWAPPTPSHRLFATAGRDKVVKVWAAATATSAAGEAGAEVASSSASPDFSLAVTIPQTHPVMAVDFLQRPASSSAPLILAVGTEAGKISVLALETANGFSVSTMLVLDAELSLPKAVLQLAWRPEQRRDTDDKTTTGVDLAIAGEDSSLRVYRFSGL